jgi:rhodanese-related sulfurtransferase
MSLLDWMMIFLKTGRELISYPKLLKSVFSAIKIKNITAEKLFEIQKNYMASLFVIDVRNTDEYYGDEGYIISSINIPMKKIIYNLKSLEKYKNNTLVIVCSIGRRSRIITRYLEFHGYFNVRNLSGGIKRWTEIGFPINVNKKG